MISLINGTAGSCVLVQHVTVLSAIIRSSSFWNPTRMPVRGGVAFSSPIRLEDEYTTDADNNADDILWLGGAVSVKK